MDSRDSWLLKNIDTLVEHGHDDSKWILVTSLHAHDMSIAELSCQSSNKSVRTVVEFPTQWPSDAHSQPVCTAVYCKDEQGWTQRKGEGEVDEQIHQLCTSNDIDDAEENDQETVELSSLLAPLSREQLELLVVKMVAVHPDCVELLEKAVKVEVDPSDVRTQVQQALTDGLEKGVECIHEMLSRANKYLESDNVQNSVAMLTAFTDSCVEFFTERSKWQGMHEEAQERIEEVLTGMETQWHATLGSVEALAELERHAKKLAQWKTLLTPVFGPIFSDPLRATAKRLRALTRATTQDTTNSKKAKK